MIFADPEVQKVYDFVTGSTKNMGEYQLGVRAYAMAHPCQYVPPGQPVNYQARVRVFQLGYEEAKADARYVVLHKLAQSFRK